MEHARTGSIPLQQSHNAAARRGLDLGLILKYIVLVAAVFVTLFPMYWLVNTSFKARTEIFFTTPTFVPHTFTLENYVNLFASRNVGQFMLNSAVVVSLAVLISMAVGSVAAYSLARFRLLGGMERH